MQKQYDNFLKWILGLFIFEVVILLPELYVAELITTNWESFKRCYTAMILVTGFIYVIVIVVKYKQFQKYCKEHEKEESSTD